MMAAGVPIEEFCTVALEAGIMQKADTLEELADKLGFEGDAKQAFLDQAERYNRQFDAQDDDDFGKEAYRLSALRKAPFYGCWFGGSLLTTIDGLPVDRDCHVLRADGSAIPGLLRRRRRVGQLLQRELPGIHRGLSPRAAPPPRAAT